MIIYCLLYETKRKSDKRFEKSFDSMENYTKNIVLNK